MSRDVEIKVRVVKNMKAAIREIADERLTSESEIAREAFMLYLNEHGITAEQLREHEPPYRKGVQHPRSEKPPTQTRFPEHKETTHPKPTHAATKGTGNTVAKAATKLVKSKPKRQATQTPSPKP